MELNVFCVYYQQIKLKFPPFSVLLVFSFASLNGLAENMSRPDTNRIFSVSTEQKCIKILQISLNEWSQLIQAKKVSF